MCKTNMHVTSVVLAAQDMVEFRTYHILNYVVYIGNSVKHNPPTLLLETPRSIPDLR